MADDADFWKRLAEMAEAVFPLPLFVVHKKPPHALYEGEFFVIARDKPFQSVLRHDCYETAVNDDLTSTLEQTRFLIFATMAIMNRRRFDDGKMEGVKTVDKYFDYWAERCHFTPFVKSASKT